MQWFTKIGVLGLVGTGLLSIAQADDWPQFRGPNSSGLATGTSVPMEWGKDKNILWKAKVTGVAWSSPIVWGDKVFITTAITENQRKPSGGGMGGGGMRGGPGGDGRSGAGGPPTKQGEAGKQGDGPPNKGGFQRGGGGGQGGPGGYGRNPQPPNAMYQWQVICLDKNTGKEIWKQQALEAKPRIPTHGSNTFATETPVCDGERLYVYFGMMGVFCYDLDGKLLWKKDLGAYPMMAGWGTASSPVLEGEKLFLQIDNEQKSFLVALDRKTGNEIWRVDRDEKTNWGTPMVWKNSQRTELITLGGKKIRSYNPDDGKLLWELNNGGSRCCATPVATNDVLYVGSSPNMGGGGGMMRGGQGGKEASKEGEEGEQRSGQGRGQGRGGMGVSGTAGALFAIKAGANGDISPKPGETTSDGVLWSVARGGVEMASPLVYEGYIYVLGRNGGVVTCLDAKTGKQVYRERIPGAKSFWASPWAGSGKIYCLDDGGTTHVLQAGPEFKVLSKNALDEMFWASPAVADGAVFLRSVDYVYCIKQ